MKVASVIAVSVAAAACLVGCSSGPTAPAARTRPLPVVLPSETLQGKWVSEVKMGKATMHSMLQFNADGTYSGEAEFAPGEKRVEAGKYTFPRTTITRLQKTQKIVKNGHSEDINPINISTPIIWRSKDEFVFGGRESVSWKRAP